MHVAAVGALALAGAIAAAGTPLAAPLVGAIRWDAYNTAPSLPSWGEDSYVVGRTTTRDMSPNK